MARPIKHGDATRVSLLDAAEALLAAGGPDAVAVRTVAESAGVSARAVYTAFGSMSALMGALAARGFDRLTELVEASPRSDDPLTDLARLGRAFRQFALERPHLYRVTFERVSSDIYTQPEATPALMRSYRALESVVQRALSSGLAPGHATAEIVFMFHSICCGLASNELSSKAPPVGVNFWATARDADFAGLWDLALTSFVNGLAGRGRSERSDGRHGGDDGNAGFEARHGAGGGVEQPQ